MLNCFYAIALILLVTASTVLFSVPAVIAHTPPLQIPTYAFLNVVPNPVGVNQPVHVTVWLDKVPPTANVQYGDRWENLSVIITKPDGTTETRGPLTTSDVGATDFSYTPTTIGQYKFQFFFPGQTLAGANPPPTGNTNPFIGDYYMPSESPVVTVTVQQTPIDVYPSNPYPSGYWQRPINGMNSNWQSIAGDWLMSGYDGLGNRYNPYSKAPGSAHILWTLPVAFGGVNGNPNYDDWNYYTGLAYEAKFNSPIIIYGRLIFNLPLSTSAGASGAVCIDLRTGQKLWTINGTAISMGQEFDYNSPNQFGVIPYIWSTGTTAMFGASGRAYTAYDPMDGQALFTIANVTAGTNTFGPHGEILSYVLNARNGWLAMWNSTKCIMHYYENTNAWMWRPLTVKNMDWKWGVQWNNTNVKNYLNENNASLAIQKVTSDIVLASTGSISTPQNWQWEVGYSTKDGSEVWVQNRTTPMGATTWALMGPATDDIYTEYHQSEMSWYAFDIHTGEPLWGPTTPYSAAFGMYSWQASIAYGYLLGLDFGGYLHAFDLTDGKEVWTFYAGSSGLETVYGSWPLNNPPPTSADGKIYVVSGHAYNPPLFKGARIYCIDANNGNLLWSELGYYTYNPIVIADGILVAYNSYDAQVYAYGQGLSATTVSAPDTAIPLGTPVLIKGTVTDQSPGNTCLGIPAAGTPAISDESMSEWMAYLYMQQPKPTNATGVNVRLTATDTNNKTYDIGSTTSDEAGLYATSWVPPATGVYIITATFEGSNSYFGSSAETAIVVSQAATAVTTDPAQTSSSTPNPNVEPPESNTATTLYIAIAAAIILIAIAAVALLLKSRK